jgi:hypothetical protein
MEIKQCTKCKKVLPLEDFHKDKRTRTGKRYNCKTCVILQQREYRKNHPNPKKNIEHCKRWRRRNHEYSRKRNNNQYKTDPRFRVSKCIATQIYLAIRGKKAGRRWEALAGYSLEDLMSHLERQFDENMTWGNYGKYWHIDHIMPKSWFIYDEPEDIGFKMCWGLNNLQPLEAKENIKKSNKYYLEEVA